MSAWGRHLGPVLGVHAPGLQRHVAQRLQATGLEAAP